jgi:hypothetical protein
MFNLKIFLVQGEGDKPDRYRAAATRLGGAAKKAFAKLLCLGPTGKLGRVLHRNDPAFAALAAVQQVWGGR